MNDRAFRMAGRNQVFVEYRTLCRFSAISFANFDFALHTEPGLEPRQPRHVDPLYQNKNDGGKHGSVVRPALFRH